MQVSISFGRYSGYNSLNSAKARIADDVHSTYLTKDRTIKNRLKNDTSFSKMKIESQKIYKQMAIYSKMNWEKSKIV